MSSDKLVRIRKYNPRQGYVVRSYTYAGIKFLEGRGWYRVDAGFAEQLAECCQVDTDPSSHPVFEIMSADEAEALEAREKAAAEKASPRSPIRTAAPRVQGVPTSAITSADMRPQPVAPVVAEAPVDAENEWPDDMNEAPLAEVAVPDAAPAPTEPTRVGPPSRQRRGGR
jgi:hypothetical protein